MDASSKKNKEVHDSPPDEAKTQPLKRFTAGSISVAVFANEREVKGETRTFYNVTASRSYEKDGQYRRSYSFGMDDLPRLIGLLKEADAYLRDLVSA